MASHLAVANSTCTLPVWVVRQLNSHGHGRIAHLAATTLAVVGCLRGRDMSHPASMSRAVGGPRPEDGDSDIFCSTGLPVPSRLHPNISLGQMQPLHVRVRARARVRTARSSPAVAHCHSSKPDNGRARACIRACSPLRFTDIGVYSHIRVRGFGFNTIGAMAPSGFQSELPLWRRWVTLAQTQGTTKTAPPLTIPQTGAYGSDLGATQDIGMGSPSPD